MLLFARLRDLVWNGDTERLRLPWRLLVWLVRCRQRNNANSVVNLSQFRNWW
jgi:hypothetical protein